MLLLTRNKKKLKILDIYIDKWLSSTFTVATIFHMRTVATFQTSNITSSAKIPLTEHPNTI